MIGKPKNSFSVRFFYVFGYILVLSSCQAINTTSTPIFITASVDLNTSIPSPTITSTLMPTLIPTLSVENATKAIYALLKTNGNYTGACFWGISPGITTDKEVLEKFQQLGISGYELTAPDGNLSHYDTS